MFAVCERRMMERADWNTAHRLAGQFVVCCLVRCSWPAGPGAKRRAASRCSPTVFFVACLPHSGRSMRRPFNASSVLSGRTLDGGCKQRRERNQQPQCQCLSLQRLAEAWHRRATGIVLVGATCCCSLSATSLAKPITDTDSSPLFSRRSANCSLSRGIRF